MLQAGEVIITADSEKMLMVSSGSWKIYADPVNWPGIKASTSTPVPVDPAPATKLLILLPGEQRAPGSDPDGSGKTGSPTPNWVAGSTETITIYAVDDYWNIDTSTYIDVNITSSAVTGSPSENQMSSLRMTVTTKPSSEMSIFSASTGSSFTPS